MKIWAISDVHLPGAKGRTMDYFGKVWNDHTHKISRNWRRIVDREDIVLIGGDISWSYKLEGAMADLGRLADLPGKTKVIVKGNHDIWWKKLHKIVPALPNSVIAMEGSAIKIEGQIFCGTRGWVAPNDPYFEQLDMKTYRKEMELLERSLEEAMAFDPKQGIHVLLHFPPFTSTGHKNRFFDLLKQYPTLSCTYGHFHMREEWQKTPRGEVDGISCRLTSSDFLNHIPTLIWDSTTTDRS